MKEALYDLKYYTAPYLDAKDKGENFWAKTENREQHLVPIVKTILSKPLTDLSIERLGAASLIFLGNRNDAGLKKWSELMYAVGNCLFLSLSLRVPVVEWADLAEQARLLLLRMADSESSLALKTELNSYFERAFIRKSELKNNPKYAEFIKSRDGMGGT